VFVSNEAYPDELTYKLVGAASETLNLPAEKVLHVFGEHWILKTAREGYGHLMEAAGDNLRDFLINLPNFHTRVVMIMPKLEPPHFKVTNVTESSLRLHYHTHREGLAPFMLGLLSGLAKMFETEIEVEHDVVRGDDADHDEFLIHWK